MIPIIENLVIPRFSAVLTNNFKSTYQRTSLSWTIFVYEIIVLHDNNTSTTFFIFALGNWCAPTVLIDVENSHSQF
jgi:hypothetical protein